MRLKVLIVAKLRCFFFFLQGDKELGVYAHGVLMLGSDGSRVALLEDDSEAETRSRWRARGPHRKRVRQLCPGE